MESFSINLFSPWYIISSSDTSHNSLVFTFGPTTGKIPFWMLSYTLRDDRDVSHLSFELGPVTFDYDEEPIPRSIEGLKWSWDEGCVVTVYERFCLDEPPLGELTIPAGPARGAIKGEAKIRHRSEFQFSVQLQAVLESPAALEAQEALRPALDALKIALVRSARQSLIDSKTQFHPPHDVRIFFPRQGKEIWAKSSTLTSLSPYFKTMISSGFQEGSTRISTTSTASTRKWTRDELEETETENGGEQAFDDSDDETDLHFTGAGASPPASTSPSTPSHPFHQIIITQAAFTTFTAAICWLETGYIQFPPLSSTFPPLTRGADRLKLISAAAAAEPTLPILASPFSVYRLAHFLELPELQQIALDAIVANLTVENVAVTGFASDVALAYPEV